MNILLVLIVLFSNMIIGCGVIVSENKKGENKSNIETEPNYVVVNNQSIEDSNTIIHEPVPWTDEQLQIMMYHYNGLNPTYEELMYYYNLLFSAHHEEEPVINQHLIREPTPWTEEQLEIMMYHYNGLHPTHEELMYYYTILFSNHENA